MSEQNQIPAAETAAPEQPETNPKANPKEKQKKSVPLQILDWVLTIVGAVCLALLIRGFIFEPVRVDGVSMNDTLANGEIMFVNKWNYTSIWKVWPWESNPQTCDNAGRWNVYGNPNRYDVVICRYPERGQTNFVKRVVGLPGDTVGFEDGYLYVNGEKQEESYISDEYRTGLNSQITTERVPKQGDVLMLAEDGYLYVGGQPWAWRGGLVTGVSADGHRLTYAKGALYLDNKELTERDELLKLVNQEYILQEDYYFVCGDHRNNSNDSRSVGPIARSMIIGHATQVVFPFNKWRVIE